MSKERPQINPKVWVLVNHNNKTIQYFLNEGQSFNGNGSYMSLEYFTYHYRNEMMLQDYSYKMELPSHAIKIGDCQ